MISRRTYTLAQGLIRICTISIILSIGYGISFVSILKAQSVETWAILYVISSIWLCILCVLMTFITLFGFKITMLSSSKLKLAACLFVGVCAHLTSLIVGLQANNTHICWQFELLYSLLPLYLAYLIYFFNDPRLSQLINLIVFSLILFITPFIRLLVILQFPKFSFPNPPPFILFSSMLSICVATSILISIHIICLFKHYNSGLLLKIIIIAFLIYGITMLIQHKIDFDIYDSTFRTYYYYIFLTILFVMYICEIFVKGVKKIVQVDMKHIAASPSFNLQVELMECMNEINEDAAKNTCILDLAKLVCGSPSEGPTAQNSISSEPDPPNSYINYINPNEKIESVIKVFPDFKPCRKNRKRYFDQLFIKNNKYDNIDRTSDSIAAIVPFYNESACEIHATLRALYKNFQYIKKKESKYKFTHFNVLLVSDGWFKADISSQRYLAKLYNCCSGFDENFKNFKQGKHKHNTVILQTKHNKKLCINPFANNEKKLFLKVTTIIKIDNRKKANSHEWFLGRYGFAEWCKCDYMFFTDAYSTMNKACLYKMLMHMKEPKNKDVSCCTGRARVYTIEQELDLVNLLREKFQGDDDENEEEKKEAYQVLKWWKNDMFTSLNDDKTIDIMDTGPGENVFYKIQDTEYDHNLTINSHLRACQMFEFEALYGTIGCYLLGGFLPVIPGPCGFYRSSSLLKDEVRGWYFGKINQENDPDDIDLVLGNMKLAEDRILTISSILNCATAMRHSLIPECIFYFDPQPSLAQLMKQRRRWLNGSIATIIFVLRKISFSRWDVNPFRRWYVLLMWYMQLLMYIVVAISPALIFTIAFEYGLATILDVMKIQKSKIKTVTTVFMFSAWTIYLLFVYFAQREKDLRIYKIKIKKASIVHLALIISYFLGSLTLIGTLIQFINAIKPKEESILDNNNVTGVFNISVVFIEVAFFVQSFVLAPIVAKDFKTLTILLKTCIQYFLYAPFYVTFFFINACANIHDLSWGTRPDNKEEDSGENNPKQTTIKLLFIILCMDIVIGMAVQPFTEYVYAHIVFFSVLALPSLYQIFFALIWLVQTRLITDLWSACKPKKMSLKIEYIGLASGSINN